MERIDKRGKNRHCSFLLILFLMLGGGGGKRGISGGPFKYGKGEEENGGHCALIIVYI